MFKTTIKQKQQITQQELTNLTKEELKAEQKKQKRVFGLYLGLMTVMVGVALYTFFVEGKTGFMTYMPFFYIPIALSFWNNYKAVEKELASRK